MADFERKPLRNGLQRRRRPARQLTDAGGARTRAKEQTEIWEQQRKDREESRRRVAQAAGKIPLLKTLKDVKIYASEMQEDFLSRSRELGFPALQVHKNLDIIDVFQALPQHNGAPPNAVAERTDQPDVGPHFDDYARVAHPWTLHENLDGTGSIRAAFLPTKLWNGYRKFSEALPQGEASEELLAQNRAALGAMALEAAHSSSVFEGELRPGTRTLLWHGGGHHHTPPAVHEIHRDAPGSYRIYAHLRPDVTAEGFEPMQR